MLSFKDIIGQESVKEHLQSAISEKKLSHAYIFSGEDGSGKMMLAKRFAAALQCDSEGPEPCGCCLNCMQSEADSHPDTVYVTHEKKNITVDDIRNQLVNDVQVKPYSGKYKIYIVDEAEKMNEAAQNALLKTLEEPPEYAVIILLTTNTGTLLQTILSRCVILDIKPVENGRIRDYLMDREKLPDYVASLYAAFSCGSIGKALRYAGDEGFIAAKDLVIRFVTEVGRLKQTELSELIGEMGGKDSKTTFDDYYDLMCMWYRDVMVYKATHDPRRVIFSEKISEIREQAEEKSFKALNDIFNELETARQRLNFSVSFPATMQMLVRAMKAR